MTDSELLHAVIELQNAKGNEKKTILEKYKNERLFRDFLYFALNPLLSYKISTDTLDREAIGESEENGTEFESIKEVCVFLSSKPGVSHSDIRCVNNFLMKQSDELHELYALLLCKKLRLGVTAATVNKIIPDLIPVWEVQQSFPIDKYPVKDGEWFTLTEKLNGVRCTYYKNKLYARSGEVYNGLEHITSVLEAICASENKDLVFDGELTLVDSEKKRNGYSDNEAFRVATGIINSDAETKILIQYTIFDVIPYAEFESNDDMPRLPYVRRRELLNAISYGLHSPYVHILPTLYQGNDQSVIPIFLDKMVQEDREGLILNKNCPYYRKRHNGILKIKKFYSMDLEVVGVIEGNGKLSNTLGAIIVDFDGNKLNVGSGFDNKTRSEVWKNKDNYIGKIAQIKYKEISYNSKEKTRSLQFPIFECWRFDKTNSSQY